MNVSGDLLLILTENAAEDILEAYEPNPWRLPHEEAMDKALKIFNEKWPTVYATSVSSQSPPPWFFTKYAFLLWIWF